MTVLLDSHALIWAVDSPHRLSATAAATMRSKSNRLLLSAATIWEIAIKCGLGKLKLSSPYRQWMTNASTDLGVQVLPINIAYADTLSSLPNRHRDPFDRLMIAQAQLDGVAIVSDDAVFDRYGVTRIW